MVFHAVWPVSSFQTKTLVLFYSFYRSNKLGIASSPFGNREENSPTPPRGNVNSPATSLIQFLWKTGSISWNGDCIQNLEIPFLICSKAVQLSDFYGLDCKCVFSWLIIGIIFLILMSEGPMNCMIIWRTYLKSEGDTVYKCIFVKAIFMISMF